MNIIPVVDLLNGVVVHAKQGQRQHYLPISSQLIHSNKPLDIVAAFLAFYPFESLYIADLNAIQKFASPNQDNYLIIEKITQQFPQLKLIVDAGICNQKDLHRWQALNVNLILGSENFSSIESYLAVINQNVDSFCLSLDFMPDGFKGPEALLTNTLYWPSNIIVMALNNVGANKGPNIALLKEALSKGDEFNIFAAGGIRDFSDLLLLDSMDIHSTLVATALHQKQITPEQLASLKR